MLPGSVFIIEDVRLNNIKYLLLSLGYSMSYMETLVASYIIMNSIRRLKT